MNRIKEYPVLTEEKFNEFAADDVKLGQMYYPKELLKKNGFPWDKTLTFTYPVEYEMTPEQVQRAKELGDKRHEELLSMVKPGVLAFVSMGGEYRTKDPDNIGNYRVRCCFQNDEGRTFFTELHPSPYGELWIECVVDEDLRKLRERECREAWLAYQKALKEYEKNRVEVLLIEDKDERRKALYALSRPDRNIPVERQDYYLPEFNRHPWLKDSTFTTVREWINSSFGCSYHTCILFRRFVRADEYVCKSK